MATPLAPLRRGLDVMPSPVADRPGLLIRDPCRYSDAVLIVPPPLVPLLALFDGGRTEGDLREAVAGLAGDGEVEEILRHLVDSLSRNGFLENDAFLLLRDERHRAFAAAPRREPAHAGSAYPAEAEALRETLAGYMDGGAGAALADGVIGIAAPHVSPDGGWRSYQAAYRALRPEMADRTFVVLGTSHYGEAESFGLTRKPYVTPLGEAEADVPLVDRLAAEAGPAARMEDYCHSVEHSIEFQVLFLQHLLGPRVRILPILCGPFARATADGRPEDDEGVGRFLAALAGVAAQEASRLFWVLGVDMAHMGRRYGDTFRARAGFGKMAALEARDRERMERLTEGDAGGFWDLVQEDADPLKWCGASPFYTFLAAAGPVRGELLRYDQWNIDDASVVTFGGLAFRRP